MGGREYKKDFRTAERAFFVSFGSKGQRQGLFVYEQAHDFKKARGAGGDCLSVCVCVYV